jgi:DNA-binding transcriptional LysR family regulator
LISAGLGVGILPDAGHPESKGLVYVPLAPTPTRVIGLAWIITGLMPASVARFLEYAQRQEEAPRH